MEFKEAVRAAMKVRDHRTKVEAVVEMASGVQMRVTRTGGGPVLTVTIKDADGLVCMDKYKLVMRGGKLSIEGRKDRYLDIEDEVDAFLTAILASASKEMIDLSEFESD